MLELTALIVITLLYIVPLNLFLYYLSKQTVLKIIQSQNESVVFTRNLFGIYNAIKASPNVSASFFYVLYVLLIFTAVYLILKFIVLKSIYVYFGQEIASGAFLAKYKRGQRNINAVASIAIGLSLIMHLIFKVFDIKILVFGLLCVIFIFKNDKV